MRKGRICQAEPLTHSEAGSISILPLLSPYQTPPYFLLGLSGNKIIEEEAGKEGRIKHEVAAEEKTDSSAGGGEEPGGVRVAPHSAAFGELREREGPGGHQAPMTQCKGQVSSGDRGPARDPQQRPKQRFQQEAKGLSASLEKQRLGMLLTVPLPPRPMGGGGCMTCLPAIVKGRKAKTPSISQHWTSANRG